MLKRVICPYLNFNKVDRVILTKNLHTFRADSFCIFKNYIVDLRLISLY